jgi:hypothetical protein
MKINEFKKLEKKINDQNFNQGYKTINMVMTVLSYFGHIASIFLAYFMLSKILEGAMTDNKVAVFIASVVILGGLELLKRDIFDKFSIQYLKLRTFGKDVMPLFLLSIAIIGLSFYASINGAAEYSSKSDKIETDAKEGIDKYADSITKIYTLDISEIESEIKKEKESFNSKDLLLSTLQSKAAEGKLSKDQRVTISDLGNQKKDLDVKLGALDLKIKEKTQERDSLIEVHKKEVAVESKGKKENNNKNSFAFVIISTLIEIVILAGVYFGEYYKFRSYREFRDKIEKDPNYQKWLLYNEILEVAYTEDTKMNQKLPSNKSIIEMCKVNEIIVMPKDMTNFLKTMASLGIIKVSGSTRYVNKQRDLAFEILRKHFNIE